MGNVWGKFISSDAGSDCDPCARGGGQEQGLQVDRPRIRVLFMPGFDI